MSLAIFGLFAVVWLSSLLFEGEYFYFLLVLNFVLICLIINEIVEQYIENHIPNFNHRGVV